MCKPACHKATDGSQPRTTPIDPKPLLTQLYWKAVAAAAPGPALTAALEKDSQGRLDRPAWIIAAGKAAPGMAAAAVAHLARHDRAPVGGVLIAPSRAAPPHPSITSIAGDHPLPGPGSLLAAAALGEVAERTGAGEEAWVFLSGGASSLAAGPVAGIRPYDLIALFGILLGSGLDIDAMNTVRKRFSRWGAGRLALALQPAAVRTFIVSDVIGDHLPAIGSGPCVPDDSTARDVRSLLTGAGLWEQISPAMQDYLRAVERDASLETPKSDQRAFRNVQTRIVASNRLALDAAVAHAGVLGASARVVDLVLSGQAAAAGRQVARTLRDESGLTGSGSSVSSSLRCLVWGGETVVNVDRMTGGSGGRCQELALSAARELAGVDQALRLTVLAAGTDGRDGPTDAAGAIIDGQTWHAILRQGRDPERDLAGHDSYPALDAAGALLRTGPTGTNVMDIVIGLCSGTPAPVRMPSSPVDP